MLLVIDNYDSFTYNLVQYFGELGVEQSVFRNDKISVDEALALNPDRLMISPGPCSPNEAGVSLAMIEAFAGKVPILGVCLGHQSIGQYFGGDVVRADRLMHGKTSPVFHQNTETKEGEIMGFAHESMPIWGVQFHPESIATEKGISLLKNFLKL